MAIAQPREEEKEAGVSSDVSWNVVVIVVVVVAAISLSLLPTDEEDGRLRGVPSSGDVDSSIHRCHK